MWATLSQVKILFQIVAWIVICDGRILEETRVLWHGIRDFTFSFRNFLFLWFARKRNQTHAHMISPLHYFYTAFYCTAFLSLEARAPNWRS